jgi:hypothetical protein
VTGPLARRVALVTVGPPQRPAKRAVEAEAARLADHRGVALAGVDFA